MPLVLNTPYKTNLVCGVDGSTLVSWASGYGAADINGPAFTTDDSDGEAVYDSSIVYNTFLSNDKVYMEAVIDAIVLDDSGDNIYFGFLDKDIAATQQPSTTGLHIYWRNASPYWWICRNPASPSCQNLTNAAALTAPAVCDIIGFALDFQTQKCYAHLNGAWMENFSGQGGNPTSLNGFPIQANNDDSYLWFGSKSVGSTLRAIPADNYLPVGYTAIT